MGGRQRHSTLPGWWVGPCTLLRPLSGVLARHSPLTLPCCRPTHLTAPASSLGSALGTIAYSAPETFATNRLRKPSDVYAFGIMREWAGAGVSGW